MVARVLVVDDEPQLADLIARHLRREGYEVTAVGDGIAALLSCTDTDFHLAVVDVNLPGMNGFELAGRLRESDSRIGILLLTARDAVGDRVRGLDAGADDYLVKPFEFAELFARLRALRRRDHLESARLELGDVSIAMDRAAAEVNGSAVPLSRREFDLLRAFVERPNDTLAREWILSEVWGSPHFASNVVDQYVGYIRRKLADAGSTVRIDTVRGVGFRVLAGPADEASR
ncbi:two-component system OmpR family response regulator [Microbacterium sp. W4I4]|uniref:response regulator transcription factor n=1 Tax=Microbacterium sp. W4I4 TaxID=3042295 RepID=UPI002786BB69|nr:response regulator transcription factor [Microbacterium sp. W4I4]MDQ0612924.1 two-component system OmpR family response regulator [Microbacterium sp. W4I4]